MDAIAKMKVTDLKSGDVVIMWDTTHIVLSAVPGAGVFGDGTIIVKMLSSSNCSITTFECDIDTWFDWKRFSTCDAMSFQSEV